VNKESFRINRLRRGSKRMPASVIEQWGFEHGFHFPRDFVDFFTEFGGAIPEDEVGYEFTYEDDGVKGFAPIIGFLHFDPDVRQGSVDDEYRLRCTDHWDQPLLVPFADTEISTFAVLDFRRSRHAPAVYDVYFFDESKADPDRPSMTWLADSFTDFIDLLEREEDYLARNPD